MEKPTLRAAEPTDLLFLQAVYASTRAEELAQTGWTAEQKSAFCQHQFAAQDAHYRAHYPTAQFMVIEQASARVGRLYVDHWAREIRIMDISLLPEYRGTGTGTRLLRDLQDQARRENNALSIHVEQF